MSVNEEMEKEQRKYDLMQERDREHAKRVARSMRGFINSPEGDDFLELIDQLCLSFQKRNVYDDDVPRAAYRYAIGALESLKQCMLECKDFAFEADAEDEETDDDSIVRDALSSFSVDGL